MTYIAWLVLSELKSIYAPLLTPQWQKRRIRMFFNQNVFYPNMTDQQRNSEEMHLGTYIYLLGENNLTHMLSHQLPRYAIKI